MVKEAIGLGEDISVAAIGPGGENLISGACIESDKHHLAAKGGVGGVMGSKKLKAIAVSGKRAVPIANPKELLAIAEEWRKKPYPWITPIFHIFQERSAIAVKNMSSSAWGDEYHRCWREAMDTFAITHTACFSCAKACAYKAEITTGPHKGKVVRLSFGGEGHEGAAGMVGISEPGTILWLHERYNRLGLDSSPVGCAISLAFECYEKGLLTKKDTDGLELTWGNAEAVEKLLDKVIRREGFGKILAEGPAKAAELIGGNAPEYAVHIKGTGINLHDWRGMWGILLGQIISDSGPAWTGQGTEIRAEPDLGYPERAVPFVREGLVERLRKTHMKKIWDDSAGICVFVALRGIPNALHLLYDALAAVTGWKSYDLKEALTAGERIINLQRVFNIRHGLTPAHDLDVSPRLLEAPADGFAKGKAIGPYLKDLVQEYHELMGWDKETGKPLRKTLRRLDLGEVVKDIWQ